MADETVASRMRAGVVVSASTSPVALFAADNAEQILLDKAN